MTAKILTPVKSIRAKCLDCCCGSPLEVRECKAENCPIWWYRMGKRVRKPFSSFSKKKEPLCTTKNTEKAYSEAKGEVTNEA